MSAPAVAVSMDGKKYAAIWMDERLGKGKRRVYLSLSDSPRFKEDPPVDPESKHLQNHPAIAIDASSVAWAAWEDDDGAGHHTIRARSTAKASKPAQASDDAHGRAAFPAIAAGGGTVGLVYEAGEEGQQLAVFRRME